jgi:outer membrane protein OmpA-like peptidoglycan-associated protein
MYYRPKPVFMRIKLFFPLLITFCLPMCLFAQTVSARAFFKSGSFTLSSSEDAKLRSFIKGLDTLIVSKISVAAYCDDVGSEAYNQDLSQKRAETVKAMPGLLRPGNMLKAEGKGEVPLNGTVETDGERRNNRRVDVVVIYTQKEKPVVVEKAVIETPFVEPEKKKVVENASPILSDDQKAGDKITLENILFIGGRHTLLPESYQALEMLTSVLLEKKKYHIMILGHICCVTDGNDGIDFDTGISNLSVARARAIYNYLVQHGVSANRLSYKGLKAKYPTGKGDKEDRRVEIEITKVINE